MTSNTTTNDSLPIFEGKPFRCRVAFARGPNLSTPTTVNPKTLLAKGDLFAVSLNDSGKQKLVMQVDRVDEERQIQSQQPEILMDESIKKTFSISSLVPTYYMVEKIANREKFALYLVEVQVKEQYLSRGDMWRFARKLVNTAVYLKKQLDIFGMRATVYGLWVTEHPFRVSSGYITADTKIVFRSLSVMCTIFLQMSKEMWDFDHHGDTYYEKAVDGFLFDLFTRWKNMLCQHDVTMTLFSRVFYDAKTLEDFPQSLREHICRDHRGRFYEDFYKVIYQNERYDDWLPRLAKIKQVLVNYEEDLVNYHKKDLSEAEAAKMPKGTISSAADGNYLETLNLSSSVFERHYVDRSFDRLGQMSLVITPGGGIFEVDRELTNMTKQRVLDNGIGSDLVCLGEQPLFAVPLFKFFKENPNTADDYQIPHWMNLSYYHESTTTTKFKRYVPRVPFDTNRILGGLLEVKNVMTSVAENTFMKLPYLSMDDFDTAIFRTTTKPPNEKAAHSNRNVKGDVRHPRKRNVTLGPRQHATIDEEDSLNEPNGILIVNKKSTLGQAIDFRSLNPYVKDDIVLSTSHSTSAGLVGNMSNHSVLQSAQLLFCPGQSLSRIAQSAETYFLSSNHPFANLQSRPKALTNPFAPASIRIPMAPGRRRWAHTFPIGPNGIPWHFHHLREMEGAIKQELLLNISTCAHLVLPGTSKHLNGSKSKRMNQHSKTNSDASARPKRIVSPTNNEKRTMLNVRKDSVNEDNRTNPTSLNLKRSGTDGSIKPPVLRKEKKEAIIWGPTGVEPWSASMITGIDWKSLTIPASLPTTFDVVPSEDDLKRDYTHNSYELLHPLPPLSEYEKKRRNHHQHDNDKHNYTDPMERQKLVFDELIDQRLSQGFQMIPEIPQHVRKMMVDNIRRLTFKETDCNRLLTVGRIYHTLSLAKEETSSPDTVLICVQIFKPQYVFQPKAVSYKYRFQCPDSSSFDPAMFTLQLESLESYPWNHVDNVICGHGIGDYKLTDAMKYWRVRLVLMPVSKDYTVKSIESGQTKPDTRQEMSHEDFFHYVEQFVRFLTMLNKLIRVRGTNEFFHRPIDPNTGLRRIDHHKRHGKAIIPCKTFSLDGIFSGDETAINSLLTLLRDEQQGLPFVKDQYAAALPECSFIAIEAIWWAIEHCEEIKCEQQALELFQFFFQRQLIRHCTTSEQRFRFGFFIYFLVNEKTENFYLESNDYAEVELYQTRSYIPSMDFIGLSLGKPMRFLPKLIYNPQPVPTRSSKLISTANIETVNSVSVENLAETDSTNKDELGTTELKRNCSVDVDQKHVSDRREWATSQYHAFYNPHCLFELEIRWLVATSCILGDLITTWSQRIATILGGNQIPFHLVPIPCDPFAEFDPLRGPIFIKMNLSCLHMQLVNLPEKEQRDRMSVFQELILKRYGFILNACVGYKEENTYYVHISGGMLVYINSDIYNVNRNGRPTRIASSDKTDGQVSSVDCGFFWCWNFCLGKKWRSMQTGEEKYQDIMLADFRAFCANDNNRLLNFWNEANSIANKLMLDN